MAIVIDEKHEVLCGESIVAKDAIAIPNKCWSESKKLFAIVNNRYYELSKIIESIGVAKDMLKVEVSCSAQKFRYTKMEKIEFCLNLKFQRPINRANYKRRMIIFWSFAAIENDSFESL